MRSLSSLSKHMAWILLLLFLIPKAWAEKSFTFSSLEVQASCTAAGEAVVSEEINYSFRGRFSYAYRWFSNAGNITYRDFRVFEGEKEFIRSDSKQPGTYSIIPKENGIEIRWFFSAYNEDRSFLLKYTINGVVRRFQDAAIFYYKFVDKTWGGAIKKVEVRLNPPFPVSPNEMLKWLHAPKGRWEADQQGKLIALCDNLPANSLFELRVLYPPRLFPQTTLISEPRREQIVAQEKQWQAEAAASRQAAVRREEAQRQRWARGKWLLILVAFFGIYYVYHLYSRFGRRPEVLFQEKTISYIPEAIKPALVGYLVWSQQVGGTALTATLFDLARRGFLILREIGNEKKGFFSISGLDYEWGLDRKKYSSESGTLDLFERELVRFLFDDLAGGEDSITVKEMKKKSTLFRKFFRKWQKMVQKAGKERGWFDETSQKKMWWGFGASILMDLLVIPGGILFGPYTFILLGAGMIMMVGSLFIAHRTAEGEMLARQWKALRRFLMKKKYEELDSNEYSGVISEYIIYGTVLGLVKKHYRDLVLRLDQNQAGLIFPWYVGIHAGSFNPAAFSESFSSMVTATSTAVGTAGGASAGGGGGAGGGGAGAG